jgi:hypothetical protein
MEVIWESMNFNAQDVYEAPIRPHRPIGVRELVPMTVQPDKLESFFVTNFGLLGSGTDPRDVSSNVTRSRRLYLNLLRQRTVVRGGLSLGLVLGLVFFGSRPKSLLQIQVWNLCNLWIVPFRICGLILLSFVQSRLPSYTATRFGGPERTALPPPKRLHIQPEELFQSLRRRSGYAFNCFADSKCILTFLDS